MTFDVSEITNVLAQVGPAINGGYSICAKILGVPMDVYRPATANNPVSEINHLDVLYILVSFDPGIRLVKPRDYKSTQMYACIDRSVAFIGDYLVDQTTGLTYFVNNEESISPTGIELTNNVLSFYRPTAQESFTGSYRGNGYVNQTLNKYGGSVDNFGEALALNWPASMLQGTKGEKGEVNIPGQTREPWFTTKLPIIPGITLETNDLAIDQTGVRYLVSLVEISELGINLTLDQMSL